MKTIALRFADTFAPEPGTIQLHKQEIETKGYVWYGKLGGRISLSIKEELLKMERPRILLIHSGGFDRYWAYCSDISYEEPNNGIPSYYKDKAYKFNTWFKITQIEKAQKTVMSNCTVISSNTPLSEASKHSMSPYFIVDYKEG